MQTALSESMPCDFEVAPFHPTLPPQTKSIVFYKQLQRNNILLLRLNADMLCLKSRNFHLICSTGF